jgi:hypothetical protein
MSFKEYLRNSELYSLDYYGNTIKESNGVKMYEDECPNRCVISESSLSRALNQMKNKSFVIMSANRAKFDKNENIKRNRKLRAIFDKLKMGVHPLIGHWQECQLKTDGEPVPYDKCPKNELKDVVERSYLVIKPENMSQDEFEKIVQDAMTIDGETQDGALIKDSDGKYKIMMKDGERFDIGDNLKLNKIAQAYSQHIKKQNVPFVFEGLEVPNGTIISYQVWNNKEQNFRYII